jgi:hypothetical protein
VTRRTIARRSYPVYFMNPKILGTVLKKHFDYGERLERIYSYVADVFPLQPQLTGRSVAPSVDVVLFSDM